MNLNAKAACRAVEAAGGAADLARRLLALTKPEGHTEDDFRKMQHRIAKWKLNGVAPYWVIPVERVTSVSRHDLDPVLYPKDTAAA